MKQLRDIAALLARHATEGWTSALIPGVALVRASHPSEAMPALYQPLFCLVAQGSKRAVLGRRVFTYAAGHHLVVSVDLPVVGQVVDASPDVPYLAIALQVTPADVASLLVEGSVPAAPACEPEGLSVSSTPADLLDAVLRLLRLLDRPVDIPVLAASIRREILWRLLNGDQGLTLRQIGSGDSRLFQVSRAIRWLRTHYAEPFRLSDLARSAGMSASAFHRHFRAVTAMSPLQYQKRIRLHEARSRLLARPGDTAGIGFSVGYDSPSQCNREYSRLCGAPPARDVARLLAQLPVPDYAA